jgi:hypothetical protein
VPLDKAGEVKVTVNGTVPFKQLWQGQWQGIDQILIVAAMAFEKGAAAPSPTQSDKWRGTGIARTNYDSTWAGKKTASGMLGEIGPDMGLLGVTQNHDMVFTTRFRRQVYTGRTVWENNAYVKETRWETVGPHSGQAVLKFEPPTFASSLNPSQLFTSAVDMMNVAPVNQYDKNKAMLLSSTLLRPKSYGSEEADFKGTKVLSFAPREGKTTFRWNYRNEGSDYIQATFPAQIKIDAVMNLTKDRIPVPIVTRAEFTCPVHLVADRDVNGQNWKISEIQYASGPLSNADNDIRNLCVSADGKKADDILKAGDPLSNLDSTKPIADQAQELLKNFGF